MTITFSWLTMVIIGLVVVVVAGFVPKILNYHSPLSLAEHFYFANIVPTEHIDPEYRNLSEIPDDYNGWLSVGDLRGVDLNCNVISSWDLIKWVAKNNPYILHEYVYRYDPSIDVNNPLHAPRVFKMLLRNLPCTHKLYPLVVRKCSPKPVRV